MTPGHSPASAAGHDPWLAKTVRIESVTPEIADVSTYHLSFANSQDAAEYCFLPGQFNMLYLPGTGEIPISVSEAPHEQGGNRLGTWAHTVRVVGNVTGVLAAQLVGSTLGLRGPFGTSWPLDACVGRDVLVVAGGIGLAPLRSAIFALMASRSQFGNVHLLYGSRSPEALLYTSEYDAWTRAGIRIQTTVDRADEHWCGNIGFVTQLLDGCRDFDPTNSLVMCCGPEVMMKFTAAAAQRRGVSEQQIWLSTERNMHCAVGFCGHCQLGPEFVCKDGPVFRYDRIGRYLDVEAF